MMPRTTAQSRVRVFFSLVGLSLMAVAASAQTIAGTAFRDPDGDGIRDPTELGISSLVITAFDSTGALAAQTASCGNSAVSIPANPPGIPVTINVAACAVTEVGQYTLSGLTVGDPYRLESTWNDSLLFDGAQGSTSVQFAVGGATGADFGVNFPEDFCQSNPRIIAGCYPLVLSPFGPPAWDPSRTDTLVVSWPYDTRFPTAADAEIHTTSFTNDADYGDLGNIFGVTVHRSTLTAFFSALSTPFWPSGSAGMGGIYSADYSGPGNTYVAASAGLFVDLDPLVDLTNQNPVTAGVLDRFGEQGLGGIDFSDDDQILWAVNMGAGTLLRMDVGDPPVAPVAADITEIAITNHGCTNGSFRPGPVETHRGKVYVGGVCDAATGTLADLKMVVLEYDGTTFTQRLSAALDFDVNQIFPLASFKMAPWANTDTADAPQPLMTNLVFDDDGSLVLGFMPRVMYNTFAQTAGFILRAQAVGAGFTLESGGVSSPFTSTARTAWAGAGFHGANPPLSEGPGGDYFFENGIFSGAFAPPPFVPINATTYHPVLFSAGVTVVSGTGEIAAGFTDPVSINSFGVRYLDRTNGRTIAGLQFGGLKVALVSDVDTICESAPLEIGNRLWCDTDRDGVQDPGEAGVSGIQVGFQCGGATAITATTDGNGRFLFTDADYSAANSGALIPRNSSCTISIDTTGANGSSITTACGSTLLSPQNMGGSDAGGDLRDSDGSLNGSTVEIAVATGSNGANDHSYDQGFQPTLPPTDDFGDAPDTYGTTSGANGPSHTGLAGFLLGSTEDLEADGQPSAGASGDDVNGTPDDEDGIAFAGGMAMAVACSTGNGLTATLTNTAAVATPLLDAWIDWNGNGVFDHPAEHLFGGSAVTLTSGANALTYDVPCDAAAQATSYARFRLASSATGTPLGAAADGEVEDYVFEVKGVDYGDAPDTYGTTMAANGPRHTIVSAFLLGSAEDEDADGQPGAGANGDDLDVAVDDEDGIVFAGGAMAGACSTGNSVTATLTKFTSGAPGQLDAWIDWNGDGNFDHPAEHLFGGTSVVLASGANNLTYDVPCSATPQTVSYARFRLSTAGSLMPTGATDDGEVEDYVFEVKGVDFGDAPDTYGTTMLASGPSHTIVPGFGLGGAEDTEPDGTPTPGADGDDTTGGTPDDEDGVDFGAGGAMAGACSTGNQATITVTNSLAGVTGLLDAWIDWNGDGTFDHPAEHLFGGTSQATVAGPNTVTYDVPCDAVQQAVSYARFRLSSTGGLMPTDTTGPVANGEVEDYVFEVKGVDFGDAPDTYGTTLAANGPSHTIVPGYSLGILEDTEADGQPGATADSDDTTGDADEDGVDFGAGGPMAGACTLANPLTVTLTDTAVVGTAFLDAWIDWNGDGTFDHPAEHLFGGTTAVLVAGSNALAYDVPCDAVQQAVSYARFRLSSTGGLTPTDAAGGPVMDGEVEDYVFEVKGIDYGDAPDTYGTTMAANGPSHVIVPGYSLGPAEDTESDGQPDPAAQGDDTTGDTPDDEDGVDFGVSGPMAGACSIGNSVTVEWVDSAGIGTAFLDAWADWNGNGTFDHPAEHLFGASTALVAGANALTYDVPCDAAQQTVSFIRFRLSSVGGLEPTDTGGPAADGEVEDYVFEVKGIDYGDAPDTYSTTMAASGPSHTIIPGYSLGAAEDTEADGQPTATADGDDINGATPNDEDGITFAGGMPMAYTCQATSVDAVLTDSAGIGTALLDAWIDWNGNGTFDHPTEHLFAGTSQVLALGSNTLNFMVPCDAAPGAVYARFRLSSAGGLPPTNTAGPVADGEVEDYTFRIKGLDWGDAPAPYATLSADGGAHHILLPTGNPFLGTLVDNEADGQPDAAHQGDDNTGTDDEDGVTVPAMVVPGSPIDMDVVAGTDGVLNAWVDFNGNGIWGDDPAEQVAADLAVTAGTITVSATVPPTSPPGTVCARFRFSSATGIDPTGLAPDGEIEDYGVEILPENAMVGAAKEVIDVVDNGDGTFLVFYLIRLENFGNILLESLQATTDLATAFDAAVSWNVDSILASPGLTLNPAFDGETDVNLLIGMDTLDVAQSETIDLTVLVAPGQNPGPFVCSAEVTATSTAGTDVEDVSQDGDDADPDGNDNPTDDNEPTPVIFDLFEILEIPTVGELGLVLLSALLLFAGLAVLKRRQA